MTEAERLPADCIIPAAGLSSRMGQWKLLLPYNGKTLVEQSVANALQVCSRVILVAGFRADELVALFRDYPNVEVVVNKDYQKGMLSSVQTAVQLVQTSHFFITHADMPSIGSEVFQSLWQARNEGSVFPGTEEQGGHPVLISEPLKKSITEDSTSNGVKTILKKHSTHYLNLNDKSIYLDIDTPADYQQLGVD